MTLDAVCESCFLSPLVTTFSCNSYKPHDSRQLCLIFLACFASLARPVLRLSVSRSFSLVRLLDAIDPPGTVSITRAPFTHREAKVQDEMLGRQTKRPPPTWL